MIKYENCKSYIDGIVFIKDKKTGYYLSTSKNVDKRIRLHRYVWIKNNGEISKGYDIHHKDKNKDNNNIDNLQMVTAHEHQMIHATKNEEQKIASRKWLNKIRPLASMWHKSDEGRKWHSEQCKENIKNMKLWEYNCLYCGDKFYKKPIGQNKFCSNKCKSAYRRKLGVDDIDRVCVICGNTFKVNKYARKTKCDKCKRSKD